MKQLTPFEHQQKIKAQIFGSYNNAPAFKKSEDNGAIGEAEKKEKAPDAVNADEAKKEEKEEGAEDKKDGATEDKKDGATEEKKEGAPEAGK